MIADISSGNTGFADVMFLVGFILFLLAALLHVVPASNQPRPYSGYASVLVALGLAAIALGWLVL